ncbi:MAG TPA: glucose-6-phosphate dehydrogenase [Acetobacteraceae bacterium]|nr:glucose-6-phosphate dehydrogenase [Acetobacteraceae bacterium]
MDQPPPEPQGSQGPRRTRIVAAPPRAKPKPADPCAMVIFGAGGDLTKRLVVPALYNLSLTGLLPEHFALIGVDLAQNTAEGWRDHLFGSLREFVGNKSAEFSIDHIDQPAWDRLAGCMSYVQGDLTQDGLYGNIRTALGEAEQKHGTKGNVIFYLAVADRFFGPVVDRLGQSGLAKQAEADNNPPCWRRVVIEKPFGHSLQSAKELNARVLKVLHEDQVFRIDHFLGKETVQNIMAFRFGNGLFEPIWNRERIDHVQVTVAETVGVEGRGKFYEPTGALRDMVPNHVFSLLAMVAMEPPVSFAADEIRTKKGAVFAAMALCRPEDAVRGQYDAGTVLGKPVVAYRSEPNVAPDSNTETYVAMKLGIDNWRWAGVPFYLRTGKYMARRSTEIAIQFKQAPYAPFDGTPVSALRPNWLVIQIQPDEGISLQFEVKRAGPAMDLAAVRMSFRYSDWFPPEPNVGYETLLYDVMIGDATLFHRADEVERTWTIVQPVLDAWAAAKADFPNYTAGSDGPRAADELIGRGGGRAWRPVSNPDADIHGEAP